MSVSIRIKINQDFCFMKFSLSYTSSLLCKGKSCPFTSLAMFHINFAKKNSFKLNVHVLVKGDGGVCFLNMKHSNIIMPYSRMKKAGVLIAILPQSSTVNYLSYIDIVDLCPRFHISIFLISIRHAC